MAEKKLENLSRVQLLEALCVAGKNAESLAKEYEMDKRAVQEYLYEQGFTKNTIKRESLVLLRGTVYDEANLEAKEDLIAHSASSITDALVIYLTGALSKAGKGEKPKQVLQRVLSPLVHSLLREEWLKLLLFIENQPLPDSILRYPPEGYLNQLLQEYASRLPAGYAIRQDVSRTPKNDPVTTKNKKKEVSGHKENGKEERLGEYATAFVKEDAAAASSDKPQIESADSSNQQSLTKQEAPLPAPEQSFKEQSDGAENGLVNQPDWQEDGQVKDSVVTPAKAQAEQPVMLQDDHAKALEKVDAPSAKKEPEKTPVIHGKTKGFLSPEEGKDVRKRPIMGDALLKS